MSVMKMTLSSHNMSNDNRSTSPTSSPRSSPRPSPRPQTKKDHSKSDTYLSVNYKEPATFQKADYLPGSQTSESNTSINSTKSGVPEPSSPVQTVKPLDLPKADKAESITGLSGKDKKDGRAKKKSAWYSVLYPTYKSRSEDYKQNFKTVPDDERLVVDYSCALQKEILVQGRLYVSQNYLCFYANIFGWETNVQIKWKDVTAITKEKTALVIPNAVLVATRNDRYFFTSFVARDKTYLMLFRVWQNALMDQQMNQQDMWQLVHDSYGAELGLTSDDEDYIAPGTEDDKFSTTRISTESYSEDAASNPDLGFNLAASLLESDNKSISPAMSRTPSMDMKNDKLLESPDSNQLPTDMSDTTESDQEKEKSFSPRSSNEHKPEPLIDSYNPNPSQSSSDEKLYPVCTALHTGKKLLNETIPLHVDQVFTLLFTNSKFFLDFHASRKTTDLTQTTWSHNAADNTKSRVISLVMALSQPVGPKTAQVTETQVMLPCSKAGFLYAIDVESVNAGVPYADSFCILVHWCIHRISDTETSVQVYADIHYKKSVWGLVKGMIERNCWQGLEDYFSCLGKTLQLEAEETIGTTIKKKTRRRRPATLQHKFGAEDVTPVSRGSTCRTSQTKATSSQTNFATSIVFAVLLLLVILNVLLYYKLWSLEEIPTHSVLDLQILKDPPKSHDEWIKLLQKQESLHTYEMQKWQRILKAAIKLLKQTEESLNELQRSIHPTYTSKLMSVMEKKGLRDRERGDL